MKATFATEDVAALGGLGVSVAQDGQPAAHTAADAAEKPVIALLALGAAEIALRCGGQGHY